MAMTEMEAVERAAMFWPATHLSVRSGGWFHWDIVRPNDERTHGLDENGHVACGHDDCLFAEANLGAVPSYSMHGEATPALRCLFCNAVMDPPKRRGTTKLFCCARHRVAYRDRVLDAGLARVSAALTEFASLMQRTSDDMQQALATVDGALKLVERAMKKPKRPAAQPGTEKESSG